jgi:hypothetical protein
VRKERDVHDVVVLTRKAARKSASKKDRERYARAIAKRVGGRQTRAAA